PSLKADPSRSYVTQPNGKVEARESRFLLPDGVPKPRAGSTVFVPARDPSVPSFSLLQNAGTFAQLAATLVALVIALKQ
ncbi:MAG TPA: hypothetical protein VJ865_16490, partial [Gemmatimonadaceae bacterium]|nr:hypothetical protein [Gemmatimonadaceae bacterium]